MGRAHQRRARPARRPRRSARARRRRPAVRYGGQAAVQPVYLPGTRQGRDGSSRTDEREGSSDVHAPRSPAHRSDPGTRTACHSTWCSPNSDTDARRSPTSTTFATAAPPDFMSSPLRSKVSLGGDRSRRCAVVPMGYRVERRRPRSACQDITGPPVCCYRPAIGVPRAARTRSASAAHRCA
jgi:hypothetical protein